ncbi:MAG: hypothetical protein IJK61_03635 [Bacteroidetes bacterium]|nr:hypothetical protein [Bacteroidota bacterium]
MRSLQGVEIFKAGTFTDANGQEVSIDAAGLEKIAKEYNEKIKEDGNLDVPVIKGHDTSSDNPAEGWVKKLYVEDDKLYADFDINDDMAEQIKEEKYKKVSICIEQSDDGFILKHIGLLGAAAPAVAGMQSISLNEQQNKQQFIFTSSISQETLDLLNSLQEIEKETRVSEEEFEKICNKDSVNYSIKNLINFLTKEFTMDNENVKSFFDGLIEALNTLEIGLTEEQKSSIQGIVNTYFNDHASELIVEVEVKEDKEKEAEASELQQQNNSFAKQLQEQVELYKAKVADVEKKLRFSEYQKQAEQLVQSGKIRPNSEKQFINMQELAYQNNITKEFNEFLNNSTFTRDLLVDNSQEFTQEQQSQATKQRQELDFSAWAELNPQSYLVYNEVEDYAKKHNISFIQAYDEKQKKGEI